MSNLFPYYPVFLDLVGRAAVLLGGDATMALLARNLLDVGAGVSAFDPAPSDAMRSLAGSVRLKTRRWRTADLKGANLVIASAREPRPHRARLAAKGVQAVFHMVDQPDWSDVALGSVAAHGALTIGVAAGGAPAGLTEALRGRLEAALPNGISEFLTAVGRARQDIERALTAPAARDAFWAMLAEAAFTAPGGGAAHWDKFIAKKLREAAAR